MKKLSLELHLCDDLEMRDFQKQFRKLDRSTDILSFPSLESPDNMPEDFLGSLVISLPAIERNAKRYKKTYRDEFLEVYLHGILHLLGFDHVDVSAKKRAQMMTLQKALLKKVLAQGL